MTKVFRVSRQDSAAERYREGCRAVSWGPSAIHRLLSSGLTACGLAPSLGPRRDAAIGYLKLDTRVTCSRCLRSIASIQGEPGRTWSGHPLDCARCFRRIAEPHTIFTCRGCGRPFHPHCLNRHACPSEPGIPT